MCILPPYPFSREENSLVRSAFGKYPQLFLGFVGINWLDDKPDDLIRYKDQGFRGLKFIVPPKPYHDLEWYPLYEKAQELRMPGLFHTGIVARAPGSPRVDNNFMRPIYLDTIARDFPEWQIIGAHLGNPWYEEASMACRWNPNLYFDLTGSTLKKKTAQFLAGLLWWGRFTHYGDPEGRHAWEKIVFGSDVSYHEIHGVLHDYDRVIRALGLSEEIRWKILSGTAAKILGV